MRPFKFFFGLTVGIILLSFLFKIFFIAFIVAAVLSTIYYVVRQMTYFFKSMTWEARGRDYYEANYPYRGRRFAYANEFESVREQKRHPFQEYRYGGDRVIKVS